MRSVLSHCPAPASWVLVLAVLGALGGCDCENRIRQILSNQSAQERRPSSSTSSTPPSISAPTEVEPNDSPLTASPIEIDEELRAVHGSISSQTDVDIFRLQAPAETILIVHVTPKDPQLDLKLSVSAGTSPPQHYDAQKSGQQEVAKHLSTRVSPLLLRIESVAGQGAYELEFQIRLADGALETEPNDDPSLALPLLAPGGLQGYLDRSDDRDFYLLQPSPEHPVLFLRLTPPRQFPQTLSVFAAASQSTPILRLTSEANSPLVLPNLRAQGAALLLHISSPTAQVSQDLPYTLEVSIPPPLPPGQMLEAEPNDDEAVAQPILGTTVKGYFHHPKDTDWFVWNPGASTLPEFSPPPPASPEFPPLLQKPRPTHLYEVTVRSLRPGLGLELAWSAAGSPKRVTSKPDQLLSWCPTTGANESLPPFGLSPLVLQPGNSAGFDYDMVVRNVLESKTPFEVEPNQSPPQADRLSPNLPHQGRLYDQEDVDTWAFDWLPEDVQTDRLIRFRLENHAADLQMNLLDAQGLPVAQTNEAGQGGAEEVSLSLPRGRYFVVVRSSSPGHCEPYQLSATVQ